jgi:uncharacterized SAM-binding protein YcdF (DUF218 family)
MFTAVLFLLLAVAGALVALRRPRWGLGCLALATVLFWAGGSGMLAARLLNPLQAPFPRAQPVWGARNAIVLLGAGAVRAGGEGRPSLLAFGRLTEAVRLYRACVAAGRPCTLILSGGDAQRIGEAEAAVFAREAMALGVPERDLVQEGHSLNTFMNALLSSRILKAGAFDHVVLVTSAMHLRRALLYFAHFGITCDPAPADLLVPPLGWVPNGYNLALTDMAIHEHSGVLSYRFHNATGLNPRNSGKPGAL